jgi:hypothetical protein
MENKNTDKIATAKKNAKKDNTKTLIIYHLVYKNTQTHNYQLLEIIFKEIFILKKWLQMQKATNAIRCHSK